MSASNFAMYLILTVAGPFPSLSHVYLHHSVGQSVTLYCNCQNTDYVCYWYKQANGQKPVKMSSYNKFNSKGELSNSFKGSPRFTVNNENKSNNLEIKDVHLSDAATYFCMSSNLYKINFLEAITLDVEGAGFQFTTSVFELASEMSSVQRDAETVNCRFDNGICNGEHKVFWFSPSDKYGKRVLYSHGSSSEQCESNTDSSTNSCFYDLPIHDDNTPRDWTKCAVALCGNRLFGSKSKSDSEDKDMASVLVDLLTVALVVTLLLSLLLALAIYKIKKKPLPAVIIESEEDIHYAALRHRTSNRTRRMTYDTNTECVYSAVQL